MLLDKILQTEEMFTKIQTACFSVFYKPVRLDGFFCFGRITLNQFRICSCILLHPRNSKKPLTQNIIFFLNTWKNYNTNTSKEKKSKHKQNKNKKKLPECEPKHKNVTNAFSSLYNCAINAVSIK